MVLLKHYRAAPLSSSFFLVSIVGIILSAVYLDNFPDWAFTFLIFFIAMFLASFVSMAKAPVEAEIELDHHVSKSGKKKR